MAGGPYRETEGTPADVRSLDEPAPPLAVLDVAGERGVDGRRGANGADGSLSGQDGQRGADAGAATAGGHAGTIEIDLAEADGVVTVKGEAVTHAGERRDVRETLVAVSSGFVELRARGGDGGKGGAGGKGGDGARGRNGADATRYSSGGNGGTGGDGGDGGLGTSGARGGDGGSIVIGVRDEDTPLLMLLAHDIAGGAGGEAGRNGVGGSGGPGGRGGDSYSWTTTSSYRDSQGHERTRTHHHRNSGGSDGSAGNSGRTGNARCVPGEVGSEGSFAIHVTTAAGVVSYPSRYDLRLEAFEHDSLNSDAVYEPNELVRVFQLDVENVGGMPTPAHDDLLLTLTAGGWVQPEPGELTCPLALDAGARTRIEGELRFRIKDFVPEEPGEPLEVDESILHRAMLPSVGRAFADYQRDAMDAGRFVIRFPARLAAPANLRSLAAGESTRVKFSVTNQSRFALGAASACKRVLRVRVAAAPGSEVSDEHVTIVVDGHEHAPSEGWLHEIPALGAGESADLEVTVTVRENAPEYRLFAGLITLELGRLEQPAAARPIQLRAFDVRVARPFKATECDLLLVVNHRTTRDELAAWEALAERLAFRIAVWDLTREGHLDLDAIVSHGSTLMDLLAGKSIAILDNAIDSPDGQPNALHPHVLVSSEQAIRAADAGIDIAFVGKGPALDKWLVPAGATTLALVKRDAEDCQALVVAAAEAKRGATTLYRRYWLRFWAKPTEDWLETRAHELSRDLTGAYPTARHVVVHRFAPEVASKFLWIKKWRVGHLETVRTLDAARGSILTLAVPDERIHDPAFVASTDATTALLVTFDATEKLERLARLATAPDAQEKSLDRIADLLLLDVANEIAAICAPGWKRGASRDDLAAGLPTLAAIAKSGLTASYDSIGGGALLRLAGRVRFVADAHVGLWESIPPWRWSRRAPTVAAIVEDALDQFLATAFRDVATETIERDVATIATDLDTEYKKQKKSGLAGARDVWVLVECRKPLTAIAITSDIELVATPAERVLTGGEYDALTTAAASAARQRDALVATAAAARRDLGA